MSDLDRKFIITAELRDLEEQRHLGDISYSRMIELLNEKASDYARQQVIKGKIEVLHELHKENRPNVDLSIICLKKMQKYQDELKQLETTKL